MDLNLDEELEKSRQFQALADEHLVDISASDNSKNRAALAFFHLCLEHQHGLHTLVEHRIFGSALAILRPIYESYVRGMWSYHCATHEQIIAFIKKDELPKIRQMLGQIMATVEGMEGLEKSHNDTWAWMNDGTHGGSMQIRARAQGDTIQNTQSDPYMAAALVHGRHWAFLAAVAMCDVCKRPDLYTMLHFQRIELDGA